MSQWPSALELIRMERFVGFSRSLYGHPRKERAAIARSFVAKAVYDMPTTRALLDRLACDKKLRRICGWEQKGAREIPYYALFYTALFTGMRRSELLALRWQCIWMLIIAEESSQ